MRPLARLAFLLLVAGCGSVPLTGGPVAPSPALSGQSPRALFAEYPEILFQAVEASCEGPGREVVRPSERELRCEGLPPVEAAAALILQFDGTVEALPRYVSAVALDPAEGGYVVTADTYIRVPQPSGALRIVRIPDPRLDSVIREVFERAGGRPI